MRKLVIKLLGMVERLYLYTHGWRKLRADYYLPPVGYTAKNVRPEYFRTHAVNSQRQVNAQN